MKWVIVVLVFLNGEVVNGKIVGFDSVAECEAAKTQAAQKIAEDKSGGAQLWLSDCIPAKAPEVPKFKKERDS